MARNMNRTPPKAGADYAIDVNSYDEQLQTNQEFVTAFLDLQKDVTNNERFLAFVDNYYVNTLPTPAFCATLRQSFYTANTSQPCEYEESSFFQDLSRLYKQQLMMRVTLRSFQNCTDEKLDRVDTWKKVSAVSFTAAAAVAATVAAANATTKTKKPVAAVAAAASVLLVALGKWIHSLLRMRESALEKQKEIIGVITLRAKIAMKDLCKIDASARRLIDSTSAVEAVEKRFEDFRRKADGYSLNINCARQAVLQSIN